MRFMRCVQLLYIGFVEALLQLLDVLKYLSHCCPPCIKSLGCSETHEALPTE